MTINREELREKSRDAIAESLGDAYDCMRVWSAWGVGTMGSDDFCLVADDESRLEEITEAALSPALAAIDTQAAEIERLREALRREAGWHDDRAKNYRARREFSQSPVSDGLLTEWHKQRAQSIRAALSGEPT